MLASVPIGLDAPYGMRGVRTPTLRLLYYTPCNRKRVTAINHRTQRLGAHRRAGVRAFTRRSPIWYPVDAVKGLKRVAGGFNKKGSFGRLRFPVLGLKRCVALRSQSVSPEPNQASKRDEDGRGRLTQVCKVCVTDRV